MELRALGNLARAVRWIGYTTRYRGGNPEFARAALTLERRLREQYPGSVVVREALETKADFVAAMGRLDRAGLRLAELHLIGHSGMYGLMFGSTRWPEQLSPHEWRALVLPFASGASAHFHACRTARWFAPFFARTFGVRSFGYQGYTCFSREPDRFVFEGYRPRSARPLHVVSVPGRKTHGLWASLRKYALRPHVEPMLAFEPEVSTANGYDAVAELYDRAFSDIRLRRAEWSWLLKRLDAAFPRGGPAPRVLDIGCGNGALLAGLSARIASGAGVDVSRSMLEQAQKRAARDPKLSFAAIDGPSLPFGDATFDVVTCFLSFRYLDWDPMLAEIRRVLAPNGRLLIVDMVEKPWSPADARQLATSLVRHLVRRARDRTFVRDLAELTAHPGWKAMLAHNPMRALHEYRWYLESRFPGRSVQTLSVGRRAQLIAFDSLPVG